MKKDTVSFVALGGQAESGKSLYVLEINRHIFIIDCGIKFPEADKLGVDVVIPDFSYLKENKNRVSAIFITHGHDDVMQALGYLLDEIDAPVYAPNVTADLILDMIRQYNRRNHKHVNIRLNRVHRNDDLVIAGVPVALFPLTHSIPGSIGVAFKTSQGYLVYAGESIIDFGAPEGFRSNLQRMIDIGKAGVLALFMESGYAANEGYTAPGHKLTALIEPDFEEAEKRIVISAYAQNIFRIREIIELVKKYNRRLVFYGRDAYDNTNALFRISQGHKRPLFDIAKNNLGTADMIGDPRYDDRLVVLVTGNSRSIYHDLCDIIDGGDDRLKLKDSDTIIIASPVLPGTENIANTAHNHLYRTRAKIHVLSNKQLASMHASIEDIRVYIQTFNPSYFIPIKGEYQYMVANRQVALDMDIPADHILLLDNGEKITFEKKQLNKTVTRVTEGSIMIDGIGVGDVGTKVLDDRLSLAQDGVVIIGMTIDETTHEMVTSTDIQTRGFIYLKDSEYLIKEMIRIAEAEIEKASENNVADLTETRNFIRDRVVRYIFKETGKRPVVLPVIIEVRT